MRLGTHIPSFAKAAQELAFFTGTTLHPDTIRRRTEAAGALLVAHETAVVAQVLATHPPPPPGPDTLVFSVDGAMVPLVHGAWTEVRTLAVGVVEPPTARQPQPHTTQISYFSRRLTSDAFAEAASGELHRRGLETARRVGAVVDGAVWCQQFIDTHQPDAVRILDFPHAAEYLTAVGQAVGPDGPLRTPAQVAAWRQTLRQDGPDLVLTEIRTLAAAHPQLEVVTKALAYRESRVAQLQYPQFQAAGWPIGSGMVESANKLVVEDRLKGAGMHWAPANVNPILALRNAVSNDRWNEAWATITVAAQEQVVATRAARRQRHRERHPCAAAQPAAMAPAPSPPAPRHAPGTDGRPTTHPWRRAWSIRQQRKAADARA